MVNQDFEKFNKNQQAHKSTYVGSDRPHEQTSNDPNYNNNEETDKSPGLTGRDL
ncbi:hypothetical protein JOC85_001702 [Bacillus mesophilus]|uniref:Uncharacterized protein n=1 Tax=Bacillus mesophilus TaxID=1808955 RepID=A0A6M0Q567_9BACI|nr:hypothetical protein [Bacillus mesophilus]MBM7660930.1 hypothetical protein [Bacillus mesophilus]NEY71526.1 hypothetical protein [Bacillus mesophilus]